MFDITLSDVAIAMGLLQYGPEQAAFSFMIDDLDCQEIVELATALVPGNSKGLTLATIRLQALVAAIKPHCDGVNGYMLLVQGSRPSIVVFVDDGVFPEIDGRSVIRGHDRATVT